MARNHQKKIALFNDFTGFGKCSVAVQLPVISALGVQCCPVPTSIFSNHTAYPEYFCEDYTDKMQEYIDNWKKIDIDFEGVCTGYFTNKKQVKIVKDFISDFGNENKTIVIDPVMGDDGKPYTKYSMDICEELKGLIEIADIVTPNVTEACLIAGYNYGETVRNKDALISLAGDIKKMGAKNVILTGIVKADSVFDLVVSGDKPARFVRNERMGSPRPGTGDVFSAVIAANAVNGVEILESVKFAGDFVGHCLNNTGKLLIPMEDGLVFEDTMGMLIMFKNKTLNKSRKGKKGKRSLLELS